MSNVHRSSSVSSPSLSPGMTTRPLRSVSSSSISLPGTTPKRASSGSLPRRSMNQQTTTTNSAPTNMTRSMTIEEMRVLHQKALRDAEAKQTELRLVLASRYRELVGSSDEVLRMRERAQELHQLVHALPTLMKKLSQTKPHHLITTTTTQNSLPAALNNNNKVNVAGDDEQSLLSFKRDLSFIPRHVHRALDKQDVHTAATNLIHLFTMIAARTNQFPLANVLGKRNNNNPSSSSPTTATTSNLDPVLKTLIKMVYLHIQTIPARIIRMARNVLLEPATNLSPQRTAAAISSLDLLRVTFETDRATPLLDLYFDSKAKLLQSLLNQLSTNNNNASSADASSNTDDNMSTTQNAETVLSRIVTILQQDIILHPYQIFCLRQFRGQNNNNYEAIMSTLPNFDTDIVKSKASHFLAAHLPLIRTKVKAVLVSIAGTTASALGQIRQSLYDKTDGVECMAFLDSNGVCSWDDAVGSLVDVRVVLSQQASPQPQPQSSISGGTVDAALTSTTTTSRKFSLWSALFSNTFSSLVHSLLTTSFHSVHSKVVSTLRTSLANAPTLTNMLPHEAYKNTLQIASELDAALWKVSQDSHELLVHAEERVESERRLRQSLYVQTCEIMGRLVCELRRMILQKRSNNNRGGVEDATKEFVVGRLCYLLKFRLTSLPTLLNPRHSPSALGGSGMISLLELQSAFDLADDNDDGLITFEEAMEAVDSAFSGTPFHGAEMIRETLLLTDDGSSSSTAAVPSNVTLEELALLSARGLGHEPNGPRSAMGTIQRSLNDILEECMTEWARVALSSANSAFSVQLSDFIAVATSTCEAEWQRIYSESSGPTEFQEFVEQGEAAIPSPGPPVVGAVSPFVSAYVLSMASLLNKSVCPSDSMDPTPSREYASTLGLTSEQDLPSMMCTMRIVVLRTGLKTVASELEKVIEASTSTQQHHLDDDGTLQQKTLHDACPSAMIQLLVNVSFLHKVFMERNKYGFVWRSDAKDPTGGTANDKTLMETNLQTTERLLRNVWSGSSIHDSIRNRHAQVFEACNLFLTSLLGKEEMRDLGESSLPLLHNPLQSSRRFGLLPIQSDRSLAELQRRGKTKEKDEEQKQESSGGVIGSGLGFFSSMLKKK